MKPQHTPTVFVTMVLTPDQHGLFGEIEDEAVDILGAYSIFRSSFSFDNCESVFLKYDQICMALSWVTLPGADVLTLAMGPQSDSVLATEAAEKFAEELRELVNRSEALFEVTQSIWQISMLQLNEETIRMHADRLETADGEVDDASTPFITLRPDELPNQKPSANPTKIGGVFGTLQNALAVANAEPSWAMQASALALSSTFVLVTPPVGIAMFTYAALRQGTDMKLLPRNLKIAKWASAVFPESAGADKLA